MFRFLVPVCDLLILNNICKYNWHYPVFKIGVLFRNGLFRLSITLNVLLTIYKVLCSYRQKNLQQIDNPANITKKIVIKNELSVYNVKVMPYTCSIRVKSHDKLLKIYKNVESKISV